MGGREKEEERRRGKEEENTERTINVHDHVYDNVKRKNIETKEQTMDGPFHVPEVVFHGNAPSMAARGLPLCFSLSFNGRPLWWRIYHLCLYHGQTLTLFPSP